MDKEKDILIIPRHSVFMKFIEVPSLDEKEVEKMAEFQTIKDIPQPKEDLVISYRNLGSRRDGYSSLMVAAAGKKMLQGLLGSKKEVSVRLHTELLYLFLLKKGMITHDKVSFIMHIGKQDSEIMITDKSRPVFSRGFKNSERFIEEVDRSILSYERDRNNPGIDDVIVSYSLDIDMKEVTPYLKNHFAASIRFYEYKEDLKEGSFSAKIDLVPSDLVDRNKRLEKKKELVVTCFLAVLAMMLCLGFAFFKIHEKEIELEAVSEQSSQLDPLTKRLNEMVRKIQAVKQNIKKGELVTDILQESYKLISDGIVLSGADYRGGSDIYYKGISDDMSSVLDFVRRLEGLEYFKKVEVDYASKKKIKGEEFTDFNIKCELNL